MTADRAGDGSSCRISASPVSITLNVCDVGTLRAASISVAMISRTAPFRVNLPSAVLE